MITEQEVPSNGITTTEEQTIESLFQATITLKTEKQALQEQNQHLKTVNDTYKQQAETVTIKLQQELTAVKAELESVKKEKWEIVGDADATIKQLQASKATLLALLHEIDNRYVTLMTGKMQKKLKTTLAHEKNI